MNKRIMEIEARKAELRALLESEQDVNLQDVQAELRKLQDEKAQIEERTKTAASITTGAIPANVLVKPATEKRNFEEMNKEELLSSPEYRSAYLKRLQDRELNETEKRALTTAAASAGAAVPTTTLNMIIDKLRQTSALFPLINVSYVPGNLRLAVANAKNASSWKAEGTNGTAADDTLVAVNLTGFELIKLVEISAAAQAMAIDAFESYIAAEIGRQMAIAIENAILNGTGTNQPTGILTGVTWDATNSATFPNNASVSYDNLVDMLALLPTMYHDRAHFVMNRKTLFGQIRKIKSTDGTPIFAYNPQDRTAMTILGYPIVLDDMAPDDTILLGDLGYYYFNFSQAPAIESSAAAGFMSGKVVYRGLAVADGKPALNEAFVKLTKATA